MSTILPLAVTVAAIFVGFQATAQSVAVALVDAQVMKGLVETKKYDLLVRYLWRSIESVMVFIVASLAVMAVFYGSDAITADRSKWAFAALAGLFAWSGLASFRITFLMFRILEIRGREEPASQNPRDDQRDS